MSIDDLKHAMPTGFGAKVLAGALTVGLSGGASWLVSTTFSDHSSLGILTEDIHNLVGVVRESKADTDAEIGRIVNAQEEQDREISRLEQAMRDRMKTEVGP